MGREDFLLLFKVGNVRANLSSKNTFWNHFLLALRCNLLCHVWYWTKKYLCKPLLYFIRYIVQSENFRTPIIFVIQCWELSNGIFSNCTYMPMKFYYKTSITDSIFMFSIFGRYIVTTLQKQSHDETLSLKIEHNLHIFIFGGKLSRTTFWLFILITWLVAFTPTPCWDNTKYGNMMDQAGGGGGCLVL